MRYETRNGRPAEFLEHRLAGNKLAVFKIAGKKTIRLQDGSYRWDGQQSSQDVLNIADMKQ